MVSEVFLNALNKSSREDLVKTLGWLNDLTIATVLAVHGPDGCVVDGSDFYINIEIDSEQKQLFYTVKMNGCRRVYLSVNQIAEFFCEQLKLPIEEESELLPCPFCGGEDLYVGELDFQLAGVHCNDCNGNIREGVNNRSQAEALCVAKEKWNRRWHA